MLRITLFVIIILHGSLHFIGLAKSFGYGNVQQLQIATSKTTGFFWSLTGLLFFTTAVYFSLQKQWWWVIAMATVILSQIVIIMNWQDAKAGTIANSIILIAAILGFTSYRFENSYRKDVKENLLYNTDIVKELVTEQDLIHLPLPVQKYLRYAGVVNKPKVKNVRIVFHGQMRDKGKDWFAFTSQQYNFFDEPTRLFFMKGKMFGITVPGYHHYIKNTAVMDIRLFGIFSIVKKSGIVMNKAETVTLFNDMCLLAPATLIDNRIQWQTINDTSVTAIFTNHSITISANLFFNQQGQLINFISNDRTSVSEMKEYPFSTPVTSYKNVNGYNIVSLAEAVWHYPDGNFTYGKFNLKSIEYNIAELK
jgi:hypothetical protein